MGFIFKDEKDVEKSEFSDLKESFLNAATTSNQRTQESLEENKSFQYILDFFDYYSGENPELENSKNKYNAIHFHEHMKNVINMSHELRSNYDNVDDFKKIEEEVVNKVNFIYQRNFVTDFTNHNITGYKDEDQAYETYVGKLHAAANVNSTKENIQGKFERLDDFKFTNLGSISLMLTSLKKNASHNSRKFDELLSTIGSVSLHYLSHDIYTGKTEANNNVTYDTIMKDMKLIADKANAYLDYAKDDKLIIGNQKIRNQKIDAVTRILEFTEKVRQDGAKEVGANLLDLKKANIRERENEQESLSLDAITAL